MAIAKRVGRTGTWHAACAKAVVGFLAKAGTDRKTLHGLPLDVDKSGLIVSAHMAAAQGGEGTVFDFVGVARSNGDATADVARLRGEAGAVVLTLQAIWEVAVRRRHRLRRAR